jgi:hypothetical protein
MGAGGFEPQFERALGGLRQRGPRELLEALRYVEASDTRRDRIDLLARLLGLLIP